MTGLGLIRLQVRTCEELDRDRYKCIVARCTMAFAVFPFLEILRPGLKFWLYAGGW